MRFKNLAVDTQVAKALGVSVQWLRAEAAAGRLPAVEAGDTYLLDPRSVEACLVERARELLTETTPAPAPAPASDGHEGEP